MSSTSRLPDEERREIMERFAPDETMRIFDRGIRRRLPAMLDDDQRRMRLAYSLLLTLPGAPVLWYGAGWSGPYGSARKPKFGWGCCEANCDGAVLVCRYDWLNQTVFAVHNLSGQEREVSLDLSGQVRFAALVDVYGDRPYDEPSVDDPKFEIAAYGYRRVRGRREDPRNQLPVSTCLRTICR
jgi:hypothetical protein